jgi:ribosome-associated protein
MMKFGDHKSYDDEEYDDEKSKSEIKRELLALKELGSILVELPTRDLEKLDLSEDLFEQIMKAKGLTHGAKKRQVGFIGGRIVHEDHETITAKLEKMRQAHNGETKQFQQLEQWRDELLAGDKAVMTLLINQFDDFDLQYVRQLVRNSTKELSQNKAPKSSRLLFKYLRECQERDS